MLPMLEREIVERHRWATRDELLDYFAIGQCTPGIIAVNTATFIGYNERGFWGAAFATAGVATPSFVIILTIASVLQNFVHIPEVAHAFAGIRAAVAALIFAAVIKLFQINVIQPQSEEQGEKRRQNRPMISFFASIVPAGVFARRNLLPFLIFFVAFVEVAFFQLSPVYVAIGSAIVGIALFGKRGAK